MNRLRHYYRSLRRNLYVPGGRFSATANPLFAEHGLIQRATRKRSVLLRPRCPTLPARPPERESLTRPEARRVPRLGPRGRAAPLGCLAGEPLPAHRPALLRRTSARTRPDAPPENDPAASLPPSPPPSCRWTQVAFHYPHEVTSFFILRSESGALRLCGQRPGNKIQLWWGQFSTSAGV